VPVTKENFGDVPDYCRRCLYWQSERNFDVKDMTKKNEKKKLRWLLKVQKDNETSAGFIAYRYKEPIGFVQWAPAKYFPQSRKYQFGPPSKDAAFLACLYVAREEDRNKGWGTLILKAGISQIKQQGFKAVETFGRKSSSDNPSGPLEFYLKNDFQIKRNNSEFQLVRLELR